MRDVRPAVGILMSAVFLAALVHCCLCWWYCCDAVVVCGETCGGAYH